MKDKGKMYPVGSKKGEGSIEAKRPNAKKPSGGKSMIGTEKSHPFSRSPSKKGFYDT